MGSFDNFYVWAIRPEGEAYWQEVSSSERENKFAGLLFATVYEVKVRAYGWIKSSGANHIPRTNDFREIDAWRRSLGYNPDPSLEPGPSISTFNTGWNLAGAWIRAVCPATTYATNWGDITTITTVDMPVPIQVTGVTVTDIGTWVDPVTGVTMSRVRVAWDDNPVGNYVNLYEILWTE